MAEIKLTKNELRSQQVRLSQLQTYLPTLQLKKSLLQMEVNDARLEVVKLEGVYQKLYEGVTANASLLTQNTSMDLTGAAKILDVKKHYENIAGVEVPYFDDITFADFDYNLIDTPAWI